MRICLEGFSPCRNEWISSKVPAKPEITVHLIFTRLWPDDEREKVTHKKILTKYCVLL